MGVALMVMMLIAHAHRSMEFPIKSMAMVVDLPAGRARKKIRDLSPSPRSEDPRTGRLAHTHTHTHRYTYIHP